jgi:hypothetical protein
MNARPSFPAAGGGHCRQTLERSGEALTHPVAIDVLSSTGSHSLAPFRMFISALNGAGSRDRTDDNQFGKLELYR